MTTRRSEAPAVVLGPGGGYRRRIRRGELARPQGYDLLCLALAFLIGVLVGVSL